MRASLWDVRYGTMTATAVLENTLRQRYEAPATALGRVLAEAAYYPRVSDNKSATLSRPVEYAIRWPYMQINRPNFVSWLVFDCDHADIYRWEKAGLPAPNLIVSSGKNGSVSSFHLLYAIDPVCTSVKARSHPIRYMKAIYGEMARLLDADPDYHGGPVCKTPGHPWWHTAELHPHEYSLGELHEYFDIPAEKPRFSKGPDLLPVMHSRAVTLFEQLRFFAYSVVNNERDKGSFETFSRRLEDYAHQINDFERRGFVDVKTGMSKGNLAVSALRYTIKSVARWTWDRYTGDGRCNRGVMQLDPSLSLAQRQRLAAERTHSERTKKTGDSVRTACATLHTRGEKITQTAIARLTQLSRQAVATYQRVIDDFLRHPPQATAAPAHAARPPKIVKFGVHQVTPPRLFSVQFGPDVSHAADSLPLLKLVGVAPQGEDSS